MTADHVRLEGRAKVTGAARYAADRRPAGAVYGCPVPATIARGEVVAVDSDPVLADPQVLAVLTHRNAPRLGEADDPTLAVLQGARVAHRGQYVALVVAGTPEAAEQGAARLRVEYAPEPHDVALVEGHPGTYAPELANGGHPADRLRGDFDTAYAAAAIRLDATYRTGPLHNHPMEPHASTAQWDGDRLTVHDSSQGGHGVRRALAALFGLPEEHVLVVNEHVGGGFGAKGTARPNVVLAAMGARAVGRPVRLALPRAHLAAVAGHRAPTVQRVRLAAGPDGRIEALAHEILTRSSTLKEFVEQAAVPARVMYRSPVSRTTHRVVRQDVPTPPGCGPPASAPACSRWSRRWTNWRWPATWTRSNSGCATSRRPSRTAAGRSPAAIWRSACARAPAVSAGPGATRGPAPAGRAGCWSAPVWPPPPTPC
ncbi:hypothetical protein GCM10025734_07020 [Kitasatospora paranensis]